VQIEYRNIMWTWMGRRVCGAYYWQRSDGRWFGPYISWQAAEAAGSVLSAFAAD
jgi:hypothetical protein